jgi:hypothetical protein
MASLEERVQELIDRERNAGTEVAESRDWTAPPGESFVILQGIVKGLEDAVLELAREVEALKGA